MPKIFPFNQFSILILPLSVLDILYNTAKSIFTLMRS